MAAEEEAQAPPPPGSHDAFVERMAVAMGRLHVRCFVGEEYDGLANIEDGWFSMFTDASRGQRVVGVFDGQARVRWDAAEGATTTTCAVDPVQWAYVSVSVVEAHGAPASGVGVVGCGALYETGADGQAEFSILVSPEPCVLELSRLAGDVYSDAFLRVPPLAAEEQIHLKARLRDRDAAQGAPRYAPADIVAIQEGGSTLPEPLGPISDAETLADLRDRASSAASMVDALEGVLAETPADERWRVEEALERAKASTVGHQAALEEFIADYPDASADPPAEEPR